VRATQFFESIGGIADFSTREHVVHLTTAAMQPMASADVAEALADTVLEAPLNGMKEISGPNARHSPSSPSSHHASTDRCQMQGITCHRKRPSSSRKL
jgi:hypothetical protein